MKLVQFCRIAVGGNKTPLVRVRLSVSRVASLIIISIQLVHFNLNIFLIVLHEMNVFMNVMLSVRYK